MEGGGYDSSKEKGGYAGVFTGGGEVALRKIKRQKRFRTRIEKNKKYIEDESIIMKRALKALENSRKKKKKVNGGKLQKGEKTAIQVKKRGTGGRHGTRSKSREKTTTGVKGPSGQPKVTASRRNEAEFFPRAN